MQQDKTIGLALGVLLIGIVGAFFFRHEPLEQDVPQLKDPESLDARIAEKPLTPYPSSDVQPKDNLVPAPSGPNGSSPHDVPDFYSGSSRPGSPAPNPIPFQGDNSTLPTAAPAFTSDSPRSTVADSRPASPAGTYTVQPGDTLSGLAHRFLGKSSRYLEIYKANRDQMKTPDDLRAGMVLHMPGSENGPSSQLPSQARTEVTRRQPRTSEPAPHRSAPHRTSPAQTGGDTGYPWALTPPSRRPEAYQLPNREPATSRQFDDRNRNPEKDERLREPSSESGPIARPQLPAGQAYRIQPGDSLEGIAIRYYGDRSAVRKIYDANRERLQSPNDLPQGLLIVLPESRRIR